MLAALPTGFAVEAFFAAARFTEEDLEAAAFLEDEEVDLLIFRADEVSEGCPSVG